MIELDYLRLALAERYELLRELGAGGMATVYLARDRKQAREVAVKAMHPEIAQSLGQDRFLREIAIAGRLQHPHILGLFESGHYDRAGAPQGLYYVMPFVEGETLRNRLQRETQLPVDDAVRIAREVADGLAHAHAQGLVHRDIKPENILLSNGHAIVADFGIAKAVTAAGGAQLTQTGLALGTPAYMSPEQADGNASLDGRSDIYSLGCMVYEMLSGQPPFLGATAQAVMVRHAVDPVPSLETVRQGMVPGLEAVIRKAMAKVPADRFASAAALRDALDDPAPFAPRRRVGRAAAAAVVFALSLGIGVVAVARRDGLTAAPLRIRSLAVLPVENLTGDSSQVYLSDGLTDEVFTNLAQITSLKVINSASVAASRRKSPTVEQAASALGVEAVLIGALRGRGDSLRYSVQLVSARDGRALWAHSYEGRAGELSRRPREVARAVVQRAGVAATSEERTRLGAGRAVDSGAYVLYTKGRYFWNKGGRENLERAKALFTEALDADPTYASAYAGLADTYNKIGYGGFLAPDQAFPRAEMAATRALAQDSTNAEAHVSLGYARMYYDWDFAVAEREFRAAIRLNPSWATAHDEFSLYLLAMGRFDEAEAEVQKAVRLDPLSGPIEGEAGWVSHYSNRQDEAAARMKSALSLSPEDGGLHFQLGRVYQAQAKFADALAEYNLAESKGFVTGIGAMGYVEGALGNRAAAHRMRAALDSVTRSGAYVSPYVVALVHTGLGNRDSAFIWLDRAVADRTHWLLWLNRDPRWIPLREDPRFRKLVKRIGLPK